MVVSFDRAIFRRFFVPAIDSELAYCVTAAESDFDVPALKQRPRRPDTLNHVVFSLADVKKPVLTDLGDKRGRRRVYNDALNVIALSKLLKR